MVYLAGLVRFIFLFMVYSIFDVFLHVAFRGFIRSSFTWAYLVLFTLVYSDEIDFVQTMAVAVMINKSSMPVFANF